MKNHLGMKDPDQSDWRNSDLPGQELRPDQDIDLLSLKPAEEGVLFFFPGGFIGREHLDSGGGKRRFELFRYGFDSGTRLDGQAASTARTVHNGGEGPAAGMADKLALLFVEGQGLVATVAARHMSAAATDEM
jgi:hypothetical protein